MELKEREDGIWRRKEENKGGREMRRSFAHLPQHSLPLIQYITCHLDPLVLMNKISNILLK